MLFEREEGHVVSVNDKLRVSADMMTYSISGLEIPGAFYLSMVTDTALVRASK